MKTTRSTSVLIDRLLDRASEHPEREAYRFLADEGAEGTAISYGELDRRARAVAAALVERGLARERVILFYPPGLDFMIGFLGALYAGAVAVPAQPPDPARLEQTLRPFLNILEDSGAKGLLTVSAFSQLPFLQGFPSLATDALPSDLSESWKPPAIGPGSLAFIQYTSGSTGHPRGVMISHGNLMDNIVQIARKAEIHGGDTLVNWLPLTHNMGLISCAIMPLNEGARSILMSPLTFLRSPLSWLKAISRFRGNLGIAPNFAFDLCHRACKPEDLTGLDLSSWDIALSGGEHVRAETAERFAAKFAPCGFRREAFLASFGLSEATLIVSSRARSAASVTLALDAERLKRNEAVPAAPGAPKRTTLLSCGQPVYDRSVYIVDPESFGVLKDSKVGEIWLRSPSVAQGYWNRPEETHETFEARLADGDGPFLRTGDLGFLRDGELYVVGRLKDLIIVRGHNHYPHDIEITVERAADIRPSCSAAFSIDTEDREGLVVVCEWQGSGSGLEALSRTIRAAVAKAHGLQMHALLFVEPGAVSKTRSGKVQRVAMKKAFLAGKLHPLHEWREGRESDAAPRVLPPNSLDPKTEPWMRAISEALKTPLGELDPESSLSAYGLDSLTAVQLARRLEEMSGIEILIADLFESKTIRALIQDIAARSSSENAGAPFRRGEIDLEKEAVLSPEIVCAPGKMCDPRAPKDILLTGATGFVGAFLLDEFLRNTNARIHCPVRAANAAEAERRIRENLVSFNLWSDRMATRIVPLPGDLAKPELGLTEAGFEDLARNVDVICHNAASVNFIYSYRDLKASNVTCLAEILRLAGRNRPKPVHYVSTLSVFPTAGRPGGGSYFESEPLHDAQGLLNGYAQSKWVAEKILEKARGRGFEISIYRVGEVIGHSVTGRCRPEKDAYSCLIKGCLELHTAPELNVTYYPVPVDYVAAAIAYLMKKPAGGTYHLTNPHPIHNREFFTLFEEAGFPLRKVSYEEWVEENVHAAEKSPQGTLAPFLPFLKCGTVASLAETDHVLCIDCAATLQALEGSGLSCASVDLKSLSPYLSFLRERGFLRTVESSSRTG